MLYPQVTAAQSWQVGAEKRTANDQQQQGSMDAQGKGKKEREKDKEKEKGARLVPRALTVSGAHSFPSTLLLT